MPPEESTEGRSRVGRRQFLKSAGAGGVLITTSLSGCTGDGGGTPTPRVETVVEERTVIKEKKVTPEPGETVKVGAVYPLSGAFGQVGQDIRKFIRIAAEKIINTEQTGLEPLELAGSEGLPNLGGAKVEVLFADHRGDPGQGRAEAERLVQQEDVDLLVGGFHSSVTKTISASAEREQVPHVNFESSSPELTQRGLEWFWRTGPHDATFTRNMFQFFDGMNERMDAGIDSVAIIHEDTEFGTISARAQQQFADEFGFDVAAGPISYTAESVTSLESEIQRIQQADPDILLPSSYLRDTLILMEDMRRLEYYPPMIMAQDAGFSNPDFVSKTELSDYVANRSTYADDLPENVPELGKYNDFVKKPVNVGLQFNGVYIRSWGGFMTAMYAINQAGSTDPDAIRRTLNELDVPKLRTGLPFGVKFDENHQNERAKGVLIQYKDGVGNSIWPFDLAGQDPVYPAPGWDER